MDLETEAKLRFLNHEDLRAWFLTNLEQEAIHKPPEPLFICKVWCSPLWYLIKHSINALKMADVHDMITFKPLTPPLYWKCPKSSKLALE